MSIQYLRLLLINFLIFITIIESNCQNNYKPLLDTLIAQQNYSSALLLAKRMLYFSKDSTENNELIITISKILISSNQPVEAYQNLAFIINNPVSNANVFSEALIYSAISFIQLEEYNTALYFLETRIFEDVWRNTRNILAAYCYLMIGDNVSSKLQLSYMGIDDTELLFSNKSIKKLKKLKFINNTISLIIPGYSYFSNNRFGYGITALALHSGLFYWTLTTALVAPIDATFFILPLTLRYYAGTQTRSNTIYEKKLKLLRNKIFTDFVKKNKTIL